MVKSRGFTLIELLVVLAIVALLMTIAAPRYIEHVERARETALRTDLKVMREAIDKFEGDQGRLPASLQELIDRRYLKEIPVDPITDKRDTWVVVSVAELDRMLSASGQASTTITTTSSQSGSSTAITDDSVADIHSGADGKAKNGTNYKDW